MNVIIDLVDPPPSLGAGYRLEARIVTWSGDSVISVPTSALFQLEGNWTVFAVRDGRAVRLTLRIGHRATESAEVLEGVSEGDHVILYPSALVADGTRVRQTR